VRSDKFEALCVGFIWWHHCLFLYLIHWGSKWIHSDWISLAIACFLPIGSFLRFRLEFEFESTIQFQFMLLGCRRRWIRWWIGERCDDGLPIIGARFDGGFHIGSGFSSPSPLSLLSFSSFSSTTTTTKIRIVILCR